MDQRTALASGCLPPAAWIGGTVYELGGFFAAQAEHIGAIESACWFPLAWWAVIGLRQRLRLKWIDILSLALCMSVLAGLSQVAMGVFCSAVALALILRAFGMAGAAAIGAVAIAWCWGLLLAAVQFLPTLELTRLSVARYRAEWLGTSGGIPPSALLSLVLPNFWGVFDPSRFHGPIDLTFLYLYSSLLAVVLILAAVLWKPRPEVHIWTRVFAVLCFLAALSMMGDKTPLGRAVLLAIPPAIRTGIHPEFLFCIFSLRWLFFPHWARPLCCPAQVSRLRPVW